MPSADHGRSFGLVVGRALLLGLLGTLSLGAVPDMSRPAPPRTSGGKVKVVVSGRVVESKFGLERAGAIRYQREPVVPLEEGIVYGWAMRLAPPFHAVKVVEKLLLPGPAKWDIDAPYKRIVSGDRRSCLLEMTLTPDANGWISNTWNVSASDPPGRGSCTVTIGDERPKVYRILFVRPGKAPASQQVQESTPEADPPEEEPVPTSQPAEPKKVDEMAALKELDRQLGQEHPATAPATTEPSH
jgi:hypothetical protein